MCPDSHASVAQMEGKLSNPVQRVGTSVARIVVVDPLCHVKSG